MVMQNMQVDQEEGSKHDNRNKMESLKREESIRRLDVLYFMGDDPHPWLNSVEWYFWDQPNLRSWEGSYSNGLFGRKGTGSSGGDQGWNVLIMGLEYLSVIWENTPVWLL